MFPDKSKDVKTLENGVTVTKRYENGKLTNETKITESETTVTEYEKDGKTPLKTTIASVSGGGG